MNREQYGPEGGPDLACILGWGNRLHHENVQWLLDQFADEGYRVHAFEIPVVVTDFEREYVAPVDRYVDDFGAYRLVGHSAGGLVAAYLDGAQTTTFLSPFWGFPRGQVGIDDALLDLVSRVPLAKPVLPSGTASRSAMGELATERELREGPSRAAPTFIRESLQAHRNRPPIDDDAVVFCSLADPAVSTRAVGQAVPAERSVVDETRRVERPLRGKNKEEDPVRGRCRWVVDQLWAVAGLTLRRPCRPCHPCRRPCRPCRRRGRQALRRRRRRRRCRP